MDLSYTQNMEDTHLWLAFGGKRTGTYLDIGAGHPIADNVSFFFYERGWQGIAVEPQQKLVDLYARLRPLPHGEGADYHARRAVPEARAGRDRFPERRRRGRRSRCPEKRRLESLPP